MLKFWALLLVVTFSSLSHGEELKKFLTSCGYGTLAGAGLGLASLVFEKKPNESYGNIARGASLGLYAGIGYGFILLNQKNQSPENFTVNNRDPQFLLLPNFDGGFNAMLTFKLPERTF